MYRRNHSAQFRYHLLYSFIKLVISYLFLFLFYLYTLNAYFIISAYVNTVVCIILVLSIFFAYRVPSERESAVRQAKFFVIGYFIFLTVSQLAINYFYSVNGATMGQALSPQVSAFTSETMQYSLENILQNAFWIISVSAPVGYVVMMWQKIRHHQVKLGLSDGLKKYLNVKKDYDE